MPVVAIVGRPNVGKSSLLNCLVRRAVSIVDPTAGVTRDRVGAICEQDELYFELIDTGGLGSQDSSELGRQVAGQILQAVEEAELVLFVVDVRAGLLPLDRQVAELLRRHDRPVILVANKADSPDLDPLAGEFYQLGCGEPVPVSAEHGRGRGELLERIVEQLQPAADASLDEPVMKLAIVGKRNVGKSTFINALAGQERVIVSEQPGTTRDAVDVRFEMGGRSFVAIDTAGLRKPAKVADSVEFYSHARARRSIRRADVVLLLIDAAEPVSEVDKKLVRFVAEQYKPCVLVVNKWDLAEGAAAGEDYQSYLRQTIRELDYAPIAVTVARTGRNVPETIGLAEGLLAQASKRVGTGQLNQALEEALAVRPPGSGGRGRAPRIYYATQVATRPPTLVLFVNDPSRIDQQYRRFLVNRLRQVLPFSQVPIRLLLRAHRVGRLAAGRRGR